MPSPREESLLVSMVAATRHRWGHGNERRTAELFSAPSHSTSAQERSPALRPETEPSWANLPHTWRRTERCKELLRLKASLGSPASAGPALSAERGSRR